MQMLHSNWPSYRTQSAISVERLKVHIMPGDLYSFLRNITGQLISKKIFDGLVLPSAGKLNSGYQFEISNACLGAARGKFGID